MDEWMDGWMDGYLLLIKWIVVQQFSFIEDADCITDLNFFVFFSDIS